jgi:hypothetical protein
MNPALQTVFQRTQQMKKTVYKEDERKDICASAEIKIKAFCVTLYV